MGMTISAKYGAPSGANTLKFGAAPPIRMKTAPEAFRLKPQRSRVLC